ncbi:hypothetical protein [Candidatus Viridilinea mediisalina]|uniref:Uncharacterized protein n=1 Tax=Candidatus Viridilinea mediisalina TaxID=2024553 RepID=A0A2A6RE59_9CHLR|nr:hypothetical protein [Candidatus Viridilinea mediisalina]PDW00663.1 hypothetical protein CJ255_20300 [Candidatus Viridilinea mediisalina]
MPPEAEASPLTTARSGIRRAHWPALLAGAGGAATVGLLGAAGLAPLFVSVSAGTLTLAAVTQWLTEMGMGALAGWVGNLATDGMQAALAEDAPDPAWLAALAQRLDAAAANNQALATELATFLQKLDAVPLALAAIAEEQGAQSDVLIEQHRLLQRLSADMERLQLAGGALGPVVVAEANRVIATLTAYHDARFDQLLAAVTALRDAQHRALINFAGAQMRDVNFQGDVAGRDIHKTTVHGGAEVVQPVAVSGGYVGAVIGKQVIEYHFTPRSTPAGRRGC